MAFTRALTVCHRARILIAAVTKADAGRRCPAPNCILGFGFVAARYVLFKVYDL